VPEQQRADGIKSRAHVGQEVEGGRFLGEGAAVSGGQRDLLDLLVALPVLPESFPHKLQFTMQAVLVAKGSDPVNQRRVYSLVVGRTVVRAAVDVEIGVKGFAINFMAH
jgi:hypothetical protein